MNIKKWLIAFLRAVPCVGAILLITWALTSYPWMLLIICVLAMTALLTTTFYFLQT